MRKSCANLVIETRRVGNSVILVARKGGRRVGGASFWLADAECARRRRQAAVTRQRDEDADILPVRACAKMISHCEIIENFSSGRETPD